MAIGGLKAPLKQVITPFQEFVARETSGGILLLIGASIAMLWANSPWTETYTELWQKSGTLQIGGWAIERSLQHWVNDGLMTVFFLLVGLEIKREVLIGELSTLRRAALPIAAAVGGMVVPAGIYLAVNAGTQTAGGWGIPMATDIAFALGVLTLVPKVPLGLKVFLTALAIVDDLGAVLVIAIFHSHDLNWWPLLWGGAIVAGLVVLNRSGVQKPIAYAIPGVLLWYAFLESGIHATVAGVILALTIPEASRIDSRQFVVRAKRLVAELHQGDFSSSSKEQIQDVVMNLEETCADVLTPLTRLEHGLHPWVSIVIMPMFALVNAGVPLGQAPFTAISSQVSLGIIGGLVIGKQVGIILFSWLSVRMRIADLPDGTTWARIYAVGILGGIGFTMSIFIANLAFANAATIDSAKLGILGASVVAGLTGWAVLRRTVR